MKRREFIYSSIVTTLTLRSGFSHAIQSDPLNEYVLLGTGPKSERDLFNPKIGRPRNSEVNIWSTKSNSMNTAKVGFLPHAFAIHNKNPEKIFTLEKWGRGFAELNLKTGAVKGSIVPVGLRLFGHAAFAEDDNFVYATLMNDKTEQGFLAAIDVKTHKIVKKIPTGGVYPHDCRWDPKAEMFIVLNSRGKVPMNRKQQVGKRREDEASSIVWIEPVSGDIKKKVLLKNIYGGYAHFERIGSDRFVVAGSFDTETTRSRPLLAIVGADDKVTSLLGPSNFGLVGEGLSIAANPILKRFAVTFPSSNEVGFWDYEKMEKISSASLNEPRAIVFSMHNKSWLVSSAGTKTFKLINDDFLGLSDIPLKNKGILGGNGSHMARV